MPAASSSRRLLRREESDVIEEGGATQPAARRDDIEEDEDDELTLPGPRRANGPGRAKREKSRKPAARRDEDEDAAEAEAAEADDPADANIDDIVQGLVGQPLEREAHHRVRGMAGDWETVRTANHAVWYGLVMDVSTLTAEFAEGEDGEQLLQNIDDTMKSLLDAENELHAHELALNALQQKVAQGIVPVVDPVEEYEAELKRRMDEYKQKTTRQKYAKSEQYINFRQGIFEVQNPGEPMPPVTDFIPQEPGDDDDDDEIEVGGLVQDYKCPLTLTMLVDPLTSKKCGHSFSAEAIRGYLKNRPKECPTTGCRQMVGPADLYEDKKLKKKVEDAMRRERMREDDEDDDVDDVVE